MEGIIGYLFGLALGLIGLVVAIYIIAEGSGGCLAYLAALTSVTAIALNATMLVAHAKEVSVTQTTEVITEITTVAPQYTATVKNADGTETKYGITSYATKEGTMELTLRDGTKVFVPVVNITIAEQTTETTTESK